MLYAMRYTIGEGLMPDGTVLVLLAVFMALVFFSREGGPMGPLVALAGFGWLAGGASLWPYRYVYGLQFFNPFDVPVMLYALGIAILIWAFFRIGRCFGL